MAAPVVQSASSVVWATSDPVVAKPTGLAEGDFMLAYVFSAPTSGSVDAPATPSGWTADFSQENTGSPGGQGWRMDVFSKVADSSDAAASDFTFDTDNVDAEATATLLRITGYTSGAAIADIDAVEDDSGTSVVSATLDQFTYADDALVIIASVAELGTAGSASTYTVSGTNPSWTEHSDEHDGGSETIAVVASAVIPTARTITSAGYTLTTTPGTALVSLTVIPPQTPVTVTPDSISLVTAQSDPSVSANVTVTPNAVSLTAAQSAPTTENNDLVWTNIDKS